MKEKNKKIILIFIFLAFAFIYIAKFCSQAILRLYVVSGIGTCQELPVLCLVPKEELTYQEDKNYLKQLIFYDLSGIKISLPRQFTLIKEKIKRTYYKKHKSQYKDNVIYLLHQPAGFFMGLFSHLKKLGIKDDYEFVQHLMQANLNELKNLNDLFFLVNKSIFTPDLGDQKNLKMFKFNLMNKKGFLLYNFTDSGNYFDANLFTQNGDFFKIYIRDKSKILDLNKALAIILSVEIKTKS